MANQDAKQDNNQFTALIAHSGTAGTAETRRLTSSQTAGALDVHMVGGDLGDVTVGNIDQIGTVVALQNGTITTLPNIPGGTVGLVTRVSTIGTLEAGTISTLPNTPGGTLGLVTTVSNLTNGSVRMTLGTITDGTLPLVTTVSNLTNGSVRITVGTITTGSIVVTAGTVATGSIVVTAGTVATGSIAVTAGTVNAGTINTGTINVGTFVMNAGTMGKFDPKPNRNILTFATTTAGTIGTLVAAPSAGSSIWLTSLDISQVSGTAESVVSFNLAATGAGVVARGNFVAGGGIAKSYMPATNANNTGTALTWNQLSGSGTVSYTGHYFIDVP